MRLLALGLVFLGLSIYAWKDSYKSLCGLILLAAVLEHKDMPRTIFDVPGLNPWNLLFFIILLAWIVQRKREKLRWEMHRIPGTLLVLGLGVVLFGFFRLIADRQSLREDMTIAGIASDYLFNPVKWVVVGLLLFDGCRTRGRLLLGLGSIVTMYFLIGLQVIRWVVPSGALQGGDLSSYTIRTLQMEIGYHRNNLSTMLAGASWALLAMLPLVEALRYRAAIVLGSLVVMFAQLLTGGRGGYLAWCVVGLTLGLIRWQRYLILAPLIILLLIFVVPSAGDRALQGIHGNSASASEEIDLEEFTAGRNLLWPQVLDKISEAPIIGHGRAAMQRTGIAAWYAESQGDPDHFISHPHNAYLETLLDSGMIGLLILLTLYGYFLTSGLSLVRDRRSPVYQSVGAIGLSLILAQLVGSITGQSLYPSETTLGMWCAIGLLLRVSVQRSHASADSRHGKRNGRTARSVHANLRSGVTAGAPDLRALPLDTPWWRPAGKSVR